MSFARGSVLFTQGETFRGLYVVVRGCLKLREIRADGVERVVTFRVAGEMVGLEGWSRGSYPHTAIAVDDSTVCGLEWPQTRGAGNGILLERLLRKAGAQLDRSNQLWVGLPALERVEAFLCDFAARTRARCRHLGEIPLPMTRADIGSYLGLAEETVVRALAKLRAQR